MGWVANITSLDALLPRKKMSVNISKKMGEAEKWSRTLWKRENLLLLSWIEPPFLLRSARHVAWLVYCNSYGNTSEDNIRAFANLRQTLQLSIKRSDGCDEESELSRRWERFVPGLISDKGEQPDCLQGSCHSSYTNGEQTRSSVARVEAIALSAMQLSVPPYWRRFIAINLKNILNTAHCCIY